jgi:hypothetical protein
MAQVSHVTPVSPISSTYPQWYGLTPRSPGSETIAAETYDTAYEVGFGIKDDKVVLIMVRAAVQ